MMEINSILEKVDLLFEQNKAKEAERLLIDSLEHAKASGSEAQRLSLLNELIGYYRQTSESGKMIKTIEEALKVAGHMGLSGSIQYATTVLNAANGYRAIGCLELSLQYYHLAEEIYLRELPESDMLLAGLYNNFSLLYQEKNEYDMAEKYLLKARKIVTQNQAEFEIAVTYANLANTAVLAENYKGARAYATKAVQCFEKMQLFDVHYCAAISALGMCYFKDGRFAEAETLFQDSVNIVERSLGRNSQYERLKENRDMCRTVLNKEQEQVFGEQYIGDTQEDTKALKGLEVCKKYYEIYGKPMIEEQFPEYVSRIAVGLVGEGSDCMGYDDVVSRDHDWGPGFCIWLTDETYREIGEQLTTCYENLPKEFMGYVRRSTTQGKKRHGVMKISEFYRSLLGASSYEQIDWRNVDDYSLATSVNGEVFTDEEGIFSNFRNKLKQGYPQEIRFLKLAEDVARVSQTGQYNYFRMLDRGERLTADRMLSDCIGNIMKLWHHLYNSYPPHDKWLYKSCMQLENGKEVCRMLTSLHHCMREDDSRAKEGAETIMETLGEYLARELYAKDYISDVDAYLDSHTEELLKKASFAIYSDEELVDRIVRLEFQAFDEVKHEGHRAGCQDDWFTFSIMRKSQYLTWDRTMLMQYLYDFDREYNKGHNLITEKYGRMMESASPEKYRELEKHFPRLTEQKRTIIEQIVAVQMNMVEEFAKDYPKIAGNARNLHTYEDNLLDTSYETYLRGEISTYSDKMLQLYGRYVVRCVSTGINIARQTIENTAGLYGYSGLEAFEGRII